MGEGSSASNTGKPSRNLTSLQLQCLYSEQKLDDDTYDQSIDIDL